MSSGDEFIMPVSKPEAQVLSEIHAFRAMADAITLQGKQVSGHIEANTRAMEKLSDQVGTLSTRVTRLEEQKHGAEIENLREEQRSALRRINDLESTRDQQIGAKNLMDYLKKFSPWILAFVGGYGIKASGVGS